MRLEFTPTRPRPWIGRYARIPGETTALHARRSGGQWSTFVDWTVGNETARCPMVDTAGSAALATAVHAGKRFLGGAEGGSFQINEYGQVLVPSPFGNGQVAVVGECRGPLVFRNEFEEGKVFDLTDDQSAKPGDRWGRPYLGIPHNLSRGSEIYFWNEDNAGGWKVTPPRQDGALVDALRALRPYGPVRFVVGLGGLVLTKVPVGSWQEQTWEPRYVRRLNFGDWYPKEG